MTVPTTPPPPTLIERVAKAIDPLTWENAQGNHEHRARRLERALAVLTEALVVDDELVEVAAMELSPDAWPTQEPEPGGMYARTIAEKRTTARFLACAALLAAFTRMKGE